MTPRAGVAHVGAGAFFRAHTALYIDDAMAVAGGDWRIRGVSLRSAGIRDRLAPQGFRYTAIERGAEGDRPRAVRVLQDILVATEDPRAAVAALADPEIRLVTLTVTEKGYCRSAGGGLDHLHPDIIRDLATPDRPRSAPGLLVAALARRRAAGARPFTALCCDNLPGNGAMLHRLTVELAAARDHGLADWIATEARFPGAMVDRITPATTPEDVAALARDFGVRDAAPVVHEPFRQWVIEDAFVDDARPALEAAGAELVADVAPHEAMKLRLLNGAHSALASLGPLLGCETVAEAVAEPALAAYLERLWTRELIPGLAPAPGLDPAAYTRALARRFANPAIRHRLAQIAVDGSQKLPQRLLAPLAENRAAGRPTSAIELAVAAWIAHTLSPDADDPLAATLRGRAAAAGAGGAVAAILASPEVFAPALAQDAALRESLAQTHAALGRGEARAALGRITGMPE